MAWEVTVIQDMQKLVDIQEQFFKTEGRYVQAIATPEDIPFEGMDVAISALRKPSHEDTEIKFVPTSKDYQFQVDIWSSKTERGFVVKAKRLHEDGIIETLETEGPIV